MSTLSWIWELLWKRKKNPPIPPAPPQPPTEDGDAVQVIALVNRLRALNRLHPLTQSPPLMLACQRYAVWMAEHNHCGHYGDGEPGDRSIRAGYGSEYVWENVAAGQRSAAEVVDSWAHSIGHRQNMLLPAGKDIGIGDAVAVDRMRYWCLLVGVKIS